MKIAGGASMTSQMEFRTLNRRGRFGAFPDLNAARLELTKLADMPHADLGDFGRGGDTVRRVMLTALLTAWDAGGNLPEETGVIGWNGDGCTAENLKYWRDYTGCERTSGRGGLFVATLPTIPYCEAAIALGCRGQVAYCRTANSAARLWEILAASPSSRYLCGEVAATGVCMLLVDTAGADSGPLPDLPELAKVFSALEGQA
jgi:hypothetical protein